jgi:nucleoside-diphosphate-sugar epimerase
MPKDSKHLFRNCEELILKRLGFKTADFYWKPGQYRWNQLIYANLYHIDKHNWIFSAWEGVSMEVRKVFLTGGTGFIGRPLVEALLRRGWKVTALVRNPEGRPAQALQHMGAQLVKGDITDRGSVLEGMQGAEIVVHNAGVFELGVTGDEAKRMYRVNVNGTENVFEAAMELGVKRTVYVSSVTAFGDTGQELRDETYVRRTKCVTPYEQSKTDAHAVALNFINRGLPLVIVCPGNVIGANDHSPWGYFARLYVNGILPPMCWGRHNVFSHSHVDDLAEGIALAAEAGRPGETYHLSGGTITMQEVMSVWDSTPGGFRFRLWAPTGLAKALFWPLEPLQRWIGLPAFISREAVASTAINYDYSSEKAIRELGWSPRSARQTWLETMEAECKLKAQRNCSGFVARLRPLED